MIADRYRFVDHLEERHVHDLHALYRGEWWSCGRSLDEVRRVLGGSDRVFAFCRIADDRLVAFARLITDGVFKALIFDVIVAADCRHDGLGRALMTRVVEDPAIAAVRHLELYCRRELMPFYEQWGFSADFAEINFMRRTAGRS